MEKLKDSDGFRLLEHQELVELFHDYNNLLNAGFTENFQRYSMNYPYQDETASSLTTWQLPIELQSKLTWIHLSRVYAFYTARQSSLHSHSYHHSGCQEQ